MGAVRGYTSCDDVGSIALSFAAAWDDRSPAADSDIQQGVGYGVRVTGGSLPDGLLIDAEPMAAFIDEGVASLGFVWGDDPTDRQEAFDFTLEIVAIDLAGNEGDGVLVDVADGGYDGPEGCATNEEESEGGPSPSGCSSVPGRPFAWALLASVALVLRRRLTATASP